VSIGLLGTHAFFNGRLLASCEYKPSKNRLLGAEDDSSKEDLAFPWMKFFSLIWPDIGYFIGAVIVS
jgi:hypothetical protein